MSDSNSRALKYWQDRLLRAKDPKEIDTCKKKIEALTGEPKEELPSPLPIEGKEAAPAAEKEQDELPNTIEELEAEIATWGRLNRYKQDSDIKEYITKLTAKRDKLLDEKAKSEALPDKSFTSYLFGEPKQVLWEPYKKTITFDDSAVYTEGEVLDFQEADIPPEDIKKIHAMKLSFDVKLTNIPYEEPVKLQNMRFKG